jgi:hypothetical protein
MAGFLLPLSVEPQPDGRHWKTNRNLEYRVGDQTSYFRVLVPVGFITDFASVPRPLWWRFPPTGRYTQAAVLHDYLYQFPRLDILSTHQDSVSGHVSIDRETCDVIFEEAMETLGVNSWDRLLMFLGVRLGGWKPWNTYRRQESIAV